MLLAGENIILVVEVASDCSIFQNVPVDALLSVRWRRLQLWWPPSCKLTFSDNASKPLNGDLTRVIFGNLSSKPVCLWNECTMFFTAIENTTTLKYVTCGRCITALLLNRKPHLFTLRFAPRWFCLSLNYWCRDRISRIRCYTDQIHIIANLSWLSLQGKWRNLQS